MLPSNLLRTRQSKGKITPAFAPLDEKNLGLAESAISLVESMVGRRMGDLDEGFRRLEEEGDYRFIRGLRALLERRITAETCAAIDPILARRTVFELSANIGPVTTKELRSNVLGEAARILKASPVDVEASLWADHDDNLIIISFNTPTPEELLRQYNLSLAQTLVFGAAVLEFTTGGNYQRIFRSIKRLGLMYQVEHINGEYRVQVSGPVSLFKLTDKYGTALARLLPHITASDRWKVNASIIRDRRRPRVLEMHLSSEEHGNLLPWEVVDPEYDSDVEERFAAAFRSLGLDWELRREPAPLIAGRYVTIPDFSFERDGDILYMEIVGFWTDEYLRRKVEKLRQVREPVIVAVDERLACSPHLQRIEDAVFYKRKVPLQPIIARLRTLEEERVKRESQSLDPENIEVQGDVVDIESLARKYEVSTEALRANVTDIEGYRLVGSQLISEEKIAALSSLNLEGASYDEAKDTFGEHGITSIPEALEVLGYAVKWTGLSAEDSRVTRK